MAVAVITGSSGLVGSESAETFAQEGFEIVGIDNDTRGKLFGKEASTQWSRERIQYTLGRKYTHVDLDVRNREGIFRLFQKYGRDICLVIHAAAQPSHEWAAGNPTVDFDINAGGTFNVLEATRRYCPEAVFLFTSTNKVYGDRPNRLPLVEHETRYDLDRSHPYWNGIPEEMSIDQCLHSLLGASKVAADVLVQEYGRYFGMRTGVFRGGTLTGPHHSATQLHGFLAYVMRCAMTRTPYTILGYKGKQVRDVIHSRDLTRAFLEFFKRPRVAEVYNIGGGRFCNLSVLEAIQLAEEITGSQMKVGYRDQPRKGDHLWWISDNSKFQKHYPAWRPTYDARQILRDIFEENRDRWKPRGKD